MSTEQRVSSRTSVAVAPQTVRPSIRGHIQILRLDHWSKNVFIIPGIVIAWLFFGSEVDARSLLWRIPVGILAVSFAASSNYVLNEILDAPFDRLHPTKNVRPVPAGIVNVRLAYVQWIAVGALGLLVSIPLGFRFFLVVASLLFMGVLYNVPPVRLKDVVVLDVLSESVNNAIRLLAGWYIAVPKAIPPPLSLILSYWMIGCYFMALKRFAEFRAIGDPVVAATYRRSFARYSEDLLLAMTLGYASAAMLFFGAFAVRYRIELFLAFPFIAVVMAIYLRIALREDSPVQAPERLYREPQLFIACALCCALLVFLVTVDLPWLTHSISPDFPTVTSP